MSYTLWSRLIQFSWFGAIVLSAVALLGVGLALTEGGGAQLRTATVVLSAQEGWAIPAPASEGLTPTGIEAEMGVPIMIGTLGYVTFVFRVLAGLFVLYQLQRVFTVDQGAEKFSPQSPQRIRHAGGAVIGAEIVNIALGFVQEVWLRHHVAIEGWRVSVPLDRDVHLLAAGVVLLAVAEAFRVGVALRHEAELTV